MNYHQYLQSGLEDLFSREEATSLLKILEEDVPDLGEFTPSELDEIIERFRKGEPIQYITGTAPFYGYFFKVNANVLIPRPETEELVFAVEQYIRKHPLGIQKVVDVGTGSGCIPITLNTLFPNLEMIGIDVSTSALDVARENNTQLMTNVQFHQVDFLDQNNWDFIKDVDVLISNPPYIPYDEQKLMSANVLDFEPHLALFVENNDPLIFYRNLRDFALLSEKKIAVFMECNEYNAQQVENLYKREFNTEIIKDLQGKNRMVKAIKL
ncbi:MAG: peptide chain release factor N(5)-glutamine methyltransferase [Saprospiraceae bacterium]|nr:peptide chain release factor N(5)-glutamine methyltransferase [Saprospiraceae bacterium]